MTETAIKTFSVGYPIQSPLDAMLILRPRPFTIRTQSLQKKPSRTIAVAVQATRKVRKYDAFWWMFQPSSCGMMTLWPRLEIGKCSETPWTSPRAGLEVADRVHLAASLVCAPLFFGPELNRAKARPRQPDEEGCDPVLDVVVRGAASWPGRTSSSDQRLDE